MQTQSIPDSTFVLNLEMGRISNARRLPSDSEAYDTDADRKMLRVSVELYDSKELKAIQRHLYFTAKYVKAKSSPSFFRGGLYLVKHEVSEDIHNYLKQRQAELEPLVDAFAAVADKQKDEAIAKAGKAKEFISQKYPTVDEIRDAFRIDWSWHTLGTPDALQGISEDIWKEEREKAQQRLEYAAQGIEAMLAEEAQGLVSHMIERLTPGEDGKQKVFRNSLVNNMQEFLDNFSFRAIGTGEELEKEVERMKQLIKGVDAKTLRESPTLRADIKKGFAQVAENLDGLMIEKPKRFINLKGVGGA